MRCTAFVYPTSLDGRVLFSCVSIIIVILCYVSARIVRRTVGTVEDLFLGPGSVPASSSGPIYIDSQQQ